MKIKYNAPVTLTFTFIAAAVLLLSAFLPQLMNAFFVVPGRGGFYITHPLSYLRLFTHVIGHKDWIHLMGNFSFILLLGPILEEKYGTLDLLIMILITALVTGLLNVVFSSAPLLGASGVVFMMILLISFTNIKNGEIPLTFILVFLLFLVKEFFRAFDENNISELAHVGGGIVGSLLGFAQLKNIENPGKY